VVEVELFLEIFDPTRYKSGLYRCPECNSLFYFPFSYIDYEDAYETPNLKFKLELGFNLYGELYYTYQLAEIVRSRGIERPYLLNVGCGACVNLHFARFLGFEEAIGVEPAKLALKSSKALGTKIYADYMENVTELNKFKFHIVYASEVIEHLIHPTLFVYRISKMLDSEGVFFLTTPNADCIDQKLARLQIPLLSPYLHHIIFSCEALESLLKKFFRSVKILNSKKEHSILAIASHKDIELNFVEPKTFIKDVMVKYAYAMIEDLQKNTLDDFSKNLLNGILWITFRALVDFGFLEEAINFYNNTDLRKYLDVESLDSIRQKIIEEVNDWNGYITKFPTFIIHLMYYYGMLLLNHYGKYQEASRFFNSVFQILEKKLNILAVDIPEFRNLIWLSKFAEGLSYYYRGEKEKAKGCFEFIINHYNNPDSEFVKWIGVGPDRNTSERSMELMKAV
jgi:2-polyprenyl-3-methyl-5-hydroxy-6-metoxy-1,4-benzoquinol methylase